METSDQMDFSWKKKKKKNQPERTLLTSDPGQVLITCHLRPFVSAGDGLLLRSQQQELTPARSRQCCHSGQRLNSSGSDYVDVELLRPFGLRIGANPCMGTGKHCRNTTTSQQPVMS